jgi:hypothetical protein
MSLGLTKSGGFTLVFSYYISKILPKARATVSAITKLIVNIKGVCGSLTEHRDIVSLISRVGFDGGLPVVARREDPGCLFAVTHLRPGDPEDGCMGQGEYPRVGIVPVSSSSEEFRVMGAERWEVVCHENTYASYLLENDWFLVGRMRDFREPTSPPWTGLNSLENLVYHAGFEKGLPVVERSSSPGKTYVVTHLRPMDPDGGCMGQGEDARVGIAPVHRSLGCFELAGPEKWISLSKKNPDAADLIKRDWRLVGWMPKNKGVNQ